MKLRLGLAALALAVVGGLVYWSNIEEKKKEGKPAADASPKLLEVPEDQIAQVELKKKDGDTTIVKRGGDGKWQMTSPQALPVDQEAAKSLAGAFNPLNSDKLIEDKAADIAQYGLAAPTLEAIVTKKDGKTLKLLLGDDTPTGSAVFAKLDGDPRIFTVANSTKTNIDKGSKDLRDKRLLTFDSDKLARFELTVKGQTMEFGKNGKGEWTIVKPRPMRADNFQVEDLAKKLKDAKMDLSLSDEDAKKAAATFASATPVATAKLSDASGTQQLEVRKDKDKNYYAKSSVVEGIHKVDASLGDGLDKPLNDFRQKKLFDFGFNEPNKIELHEGAKTLSFQKSGDKWMAGAKQMDSTGVQSLIDKLRDLTSIKFMDTAAGAPYLDVTVTSQDGKQVEKVIVTKTDNYYYAHRENEASFYELDGKAVDELQKTAADVKEAQAAKPVEKKK
jgi:hypothetical protein